MDQNLKPHSHNKSGKNTVSSLLDNKTFYTVIFLILAAIAIVLIFYLISSRNPHRNLNAPPPNYSALYKDADKAIKNKDLDKAQQDLQKIVLTNPKYKDAKKKLASVTKENLYQKVLNSLKAGNIKDALKYLDQLALYDPNYKDSQAIREDLKDGRYDGNAAGNVPGANSNNGGANPPGDNNGGGGTNPPGDNNGGGTNPPDEGGNINEPTDSPLAILPVDLTGYNMLQKQWLTPTEAQGVYRSKDKLSRLNIDLVVINVVKYDKKAEAQSQLFNKEEDFSSNTDIISVNGHDAYYGRYPANEFPRASIMTWTINGWFFSVTAIPGKKLVSNPDNANGVLKSTVTDVTKNFGF